MKRYLYVANGLFEVSRGSRDGGRVIFTLQLAWYHIF